jgi:hypothetical protein
VLLRPLAKANIRNPARGDDAVFAIHCLQAVGVREDDLPLLALHLTPASDPWTRHLAAEAVAQLGPKAAPVLPQLCECIAASSSHGLPTAELLAIKAMGPAAAPAIEYLRLSLWTPFRTYSLSEDPRRTVIEAAGAIGPPAASLAPEMLELAEDAPHLRVPITAALIRIMPDDPMVYTWALEVLNSPDVAAHGLIDEALFSAPTLRGQLINTLRAQAHDQQSCIRLAAVRAMLSMWVPPRLEDTPLARDLERPVRLLAERWMHASSVRSLPETTSAHPDPHKGQTR